jgi:putative addiction module antidote
MTTVKVIAVGNSLGIVLPKEVLKRLRVGQGERLFVTETIDGVEVSPYDPQFAGQFAVAERVLRKRRNMLRRLAE